MNITVGYPPDRRRSVRIYLRLNRRLVIVLRSLGVFSLLVAAASYRSPGSVAVWTALGVALLAEPSLVFWTIVRRNHEAFDEDIEVTMTDSTVTHRTRTTSVELSWDMVRRVHEGKDFWIFTVSRLKYVSLWKGALTPGQAAELAAFLARRRVGHAAVTPPAKTPPRDARP
ncbi:MAG TPA: YcxB family protein [Streptosporangiaceae bacterium]|jgi:hypothetical protein|nr:YcxB family protein [Streptosporangiaceae bacterium]